MSTSVVWFRQDLRLHDNPALNAALQSGDAVIPLFIWCPEEESPWAPASATQWWLHHSLQSLSDSLKDLGSRLLIRSGSCLETLWEVARATGADSVYWNRRYEPKAISRDKEIKTKLRDDGFTVESFNAQLLFEPWTISTQKDEPYQVFTPFSKACLNANRPDDPLSEPEKMKAPKKWIKSESLKSLELLPKKWKAQFGDFWTPGEQGARKRWDDFRSSLDDYAEQRENPATEGSSRLSPHLHFGEISPRLLWRDLHQGRGRPTKGEHSFRNELLWREFAHHILYHFPSTTDEPMREQFSDFPWEKDAKMLKAWQRGRTGYPMVDAGMRELWTTGWMHNRARMIVASFLVKHLLQPWQEGAKWFWDTLVDADLANNSLNWQWSAGCGADAAPFFRIFNPILQGEKFDPEGEYVSQWVPELADLPAKWIHKPWDAPEKVLKEAGVELGKDYPEPIVDHPEARERALEHYKQITS